MKDEKDINRYSGAVLVRMSPDLLKWFTGKSPKTGESKKLRSTVTNGEHYFTKTDLNAFDRYLKEPWPFKDGARPNIPAGIKREIKAEAGYMCAMCGTSIRELAHIDPVYDTKNNHPHNLICLCPNHHTEFDNGSIGKGDITALKKELLDNRVSLWKLQADGFDHALNTISELGKPSKLPPSILKLLEAESLAELGKAAKHAKQTEFTQNVSRVLSESSPVQKLSAVKDDELGRLGQAECPLCEGSGLRNGGECPVCEGSGAVDKSIVNDIDLDPYKQVECPLCEGSKQHGGDECPICEGYGELDQRYEDVDLDGFKQVECLLCEGSKQHGGDECPVCEGCGEIDQKDEDIDLDQFKQVECPLCKGSKQHRGDECPVCEGYGEIDQRHEDIDLSQFK